MQSSGEVADRWVQVMLAFGSLVMVAPSTCGGPSAARQSCLGECARNKDSCMLEAMSAAEVQGCDTRSQQCNVECPER